MGTIHYMNGEPPDNSAMGGLHRFLEHAGQPHIERRIFTFVIIALDALILLYIVRPDIIQRKLFMSLPPGTVCVSSQMKIIACDSLMGWYK